MLQVMREPPQVPQRVIYTSLQDIRKDMIQLPVPWVVLLDTEDHVALGVVNECIVVFRVDVHQNLDVDVQVLGGVRGAGLNKNMENVRLNFFLNSLTEMKICTGVSSPELQKFASIAGTKEFFLHVSNRSENGVIVSNTCVRSRLCLGLLNAESGSDLCSECEKVDIKMKKRHAEEKEKANKPLKKMIPCTLYLIIN